MTAYDVLSLSEKTLLGTYGSPDVASFIASKVGGKVRIRTKGFRITDRDFMVTARVADFMARKDEVNAK